MRDESTNYNAYPYGRWIKWAAVGLIALILPVSGVSMYNGLVSAEQNVDRNWSQVENQMQRRADLVTNLVKVVKGYTKHEAKVFGDIAAARSVLINGSEEIQNELDEDRKLVEAARQVLLIMENYSDIKADKQFLMFKERKNGGFDSLIRRIDASGKVSHHSGSFIPYL